MTDEHTSGYENLLTDQKARIQNPSICTGIKRGSYFVIWWDWKQHRHELSSRSEAEAFAENLRRQMIPS